MSLFDINFCNYFIDGDRIILITSVLNDKIVAVVEIYNSFVFTNQYHVKEVIKNFTKAHNVDIKNNRYSFFDEYNHYIGEVEV